MAIKKEVGRMRLNDELVFGNSQMLERLGPSQSFLSIRVDAQKRCSTLAAVSACERRRKGASATGIDAYRAPPGSCKGRRVAELG